MSKMILKNEFNKIEAGLSQQGYGWLVNYAGELGAKIFKPASAGFILKALKGGKNE